MAVPGTVKFFQEKQDFVMDKIDVPRLRSLRKSIAMRMKKPFYSIKNQNNFVELNIHTFFKKYMNEFDLWWDDDFKKIIAEKHIDLYGRLFTVGKKYKKYWFDRKTFNWETSSEKFIAHNKFVEVMSNWDLIVWNEDSIESMIDSFGYRHFEAFWDEWNEKEKTIARKDCVCSLNMFCNEQFDIWFDSDIVPVAEYIQDLSHYSKHNFKKWFDKSVIPNDEIFYCTEALCSYVPEHFTDWFSKETFDYVSYSEFLIIQFSEHFTLWYDESLIPLSRKIKMGKSVIRDLIKKQEGLDYHHFIQVKDLLFLTLSDKFELWYKKKYFRPRDEMFILLKHYAMKHQDMWNEQYILHQLKK